MDLKHKAHNFCHLAMVKVFDGLPNSLNYDQFNSPRLLEIVVENVLRFGVMSKISEL